LATGGTATGATGAGLERLELRVERLQITFRFTFAFHAREVRFERDAGEGFERVFPETFSFNARSHDPMELFIQLDDLLRKTRLLGPGAHHRDSRELVRRLLAEAPRYLERLYDRLEAGGRLEGDMRLRVSQDIAVLAQVLLRFLETRELELNRPLKMAGYALRKLIFRALQVLMLGRVEPAYLEDYIAGRVDPVDPSDDSSESGFFHILESGETDVVNRIVVRMTERSFYRWLDGVCLDEENQAFEKQDSPFADRETEVLRAIAAPATESIQRGKDLSPFLRRDDRDCLRILKKLERWFLRQYDIRHASSIIYHAAVLERGADDGADLLTWHTQRIYAAALLAMGAPFTAAIFFYERAPQLFDLVCSIEVLAVNTVAIWFLLYRFIWKRDLSFFHASVPRIGAGIIVGYLPVFLIDEVWDLASRPAWALLALVFFLGLVTLLYIYVEIRRRLGNADMAFDRARGIFLLGVVEAGGVGLVMTGLVGRFMVIRNWSPGADELPVEVLRGTLDPLLGQMPQIMGVAPFHAFPSALLLMTFLSFFIGIFLQLMWEELPITEPL
jgi:hypothetical protein